MNETNNIFEETNPEITVDEPIVDTLEETTNELASEIDENATESEFAERLLVFVISASLAAVIAFIVKNWNKIRKWHLEHVIKRGIQQRNKGHEKSKDAQEKLNVLLEKMKKKDVEKEPETTEVTASVSED